MTSENSWDQSLTEKLLQIKAPQNWSEKTGPFFHLQIPGEAPIGPFHGLELKNFFEETSFPEGTCVRDAKAIGDWKEIFTHQFFQRRKPQLISSEDFPDEYEQAFVLIEGQKEGPYTHDEVNALIDEKELLLTDQVSFDGGQTWRKLFEYEDFDRRNHQQSNLPESPGWDVFKESNTEINQQLSNPSEHKQEEDALAGLAFLENLKSGKTAKSFDKVALRPGEIPDQDSTEEQDIPEVPQNVVAHPATLKQQENATATNKKTKNYAYATAVAVMLMSSVYFLTSDPKTANNAQTAQSTQTSQDAPTLEPVKNQAQNKAAQKNSYRSPRLKARTNPRTRKPASITTTDSFRRDDRRMDEDPYYGNQQDSYDNYKDDYQDSYQESAYNEEEVYDYDRGETPVQQDPIRARLDKKTIDPEKEYYDDQQQEYYDTQYEADYADAPQIEPEEVWGAEERLPASDEIIENGDIYQDDAY